MTAEENKNKDEEVDEVEDAKKAACLVVIFLHGVGGCGEEWKDRLAGILPTGTRIHTPTAPTAQVTLFGNKHCNSWYSWRGIGLTITMGEGMGWGCGFKY